MLKLTGFEAQVEVMGRVCVARYTTSVLEIEGLTLAEAHDALEALATGEVVAADDSKLHVAQTPTTGVGKIFGALPDLVAPKGESAPIAHAVVAVDESPPKQEATPPKSKKRRARSVADTVGKVDEAPAPKGGGSTTAPSSAAVAPTTAAASTTETVPAADPPKCVACDDEGTNSRGNPCGACRPTEAAEQKPTGHGRADASSMRAPAADDFADPSEGPQRNSAPTPAPKSGSVEAPIKMDPPQPPPSGNGVPEELLSAVRVQTVLGYLMDHGFTSKEQIVAECLRIKDEVPVLGRVVKLKERVERTLGVMQLVD